MAQYLTGEHKQTENPSAQLPASMCSLDHSSQLCSILAARYIKSLNARVVNTFQTQIDKAYSIHLTVANDRTSPETLTMPPLTLHAAMWQHSSPNSYHSLACHLAIIFALLAFGFMFGLILSVYFDSRAKRRFKRFAVRPANRLAMILRGLKD